MTEMEQVCEGTAWTQGIPVEMPLYADDTVIGILLACLFIIVAVLSDKKGFLSDVFNNFFLLRSQQEEGTSTVSAFYMRLALLAVSFALISLLMALYMAGPVGLFQWRPLLLFFVLCAVGFGIKLLVFRAVNWVFFDSSRIAIWQRDYISWGVLSALPLYLLTLLAVFANWNSHKVMVLLLAWVILAEIALFVKAFHIFSVKKYGSLQLFVYLCALELIPLLIAGKALASYCVE